MVKRINFRLSIVCFLLFIPRVVFSAPVAPDNITLQLKWKHQFQFAGYYAAIEKGYYAAAGLKVRLKEGRPNLDIADELVSGRADYGVAMPNMLLERQKGKPVVALAAIFQHSPEALFALKKSGINNPHDLFGKVVMLRPRGNAETRAMLLAEGLGPGKVKTVPHSWDINDLVNGRVDAAGGYITDRPFILRKRGIAYTVIRPISYGIDFYGDCLFTTEKEIHAHPQRVKNFLRASIKGWDYAMRHPEEIADLILRKYSSRLSRKALLFEAGQMRELMQPRFIEIGHMNPGRWKRIADTFVKLGMLKPGYSLSGFIYNPDQRPGYTTYRRILWAMLLIITVTVICMILLFLFNRRLNREVAKRTGQLKEEQLFTEAILKTLPGVFYVYEDGERLIKWNENFQKESGYSHAEMLNRHPLDWFHDREKEKIRDKLRLAFSKGDASVEANLRFKEREVPYYLTGTILSSGDKTYLIGVGIDMSARRQLEDQLRQAQKMESIGRLAGGVAHDFNNVLTTILGYSDLLLTAMAKTDPHREQIAIIRSAGEKAAALTRQLLAFSRKQILEKKVVSINTIIGELLKILGKMLGEDIRIETYPDAVNGIIKADQGQIEQILMNLAVNARDAMPTGGTITIETRDIVIDAEYAESHLDIEPGPYVMLAFSDTGEGMSQTIREHIFDPFFTTKERDKGTGLGLATVYGIVMQHNGRIYVYSEPGRGTTFKIYLPASTEAIEPHHDNRQNHPLSRGNETVLVVDDDSFICKLIIDTLEPLGYECLEASCGKDAIAIARRVRGEIHLLLTDVVMPGMSGKDLADTVCAERQRMKVLFMSGYTENAIAHHGVLDAGVNYIPKPITPIDLTRKIRSVLDGDG